MNAILDALEFVKGAVARQDFVPALTHFCIRNGTVTGFNGSLGLQSPVAISFNACPDARQFIRAIEACSGTIGLAMTANDKLCVRSGKLKTFIDCLDTNQFPFIAPEGKFVELNPEFITALEDVQPFIGEDHNRAFCCGVCVDGKSLLATNNLVIVERWTGIAFPLRLIIPDTAVKELLRIGESPKRVQVMENRLVFHYDNGRWLSTQTINAQFPDVKLALNRSFKQSDEYQPDETFWHSLEQICEFSTKTGYVYFHGDRLATLADDSTQGTSVQCPNAPTLGVYNAKQLLKLRETAKVIRFGSYPEPITFAGDLMRGVFAGVRPA